MTLLATVKAVSKSALPRPPLRSPISITSSAKQRLNDLYLSHLKSLNSNIDKEMYIKIGVKTKGCSGNAYTLNWVDSVDKLDEKVKIEDRFSLVIDGKALFTLLGSQMDYVEEKLSAGFVFNNPNIKETCGCGMSFTV